MLDFLSIKLTYENGFGFSYDLIFFIQTTDEIHSTLFHLFRSLIVFTVSL